jgi:hypothetical protein
MRINSLGWAVVVLALTFTIWNFMEYQRTTPAGFSPGTPWAQIKWQPVGAPLTWDEVSKIWFRRHAVYVERGVLIVGFAVAAFLIVNPRRKAA